MEGLPPGVLILIVAALSAAVGALLTWLITYIGRERGPAPRHHPEDEEPATDDLLRVVRTKGGPSVVVQGKRLRHLREIKDRDVGQETVLAVEAVLKFAEGWLPALQREKRPFTSAKTQSAAGVTASPPPIHQGSPLAGQRAVAGGTASAEPLRLVEEINGLIQERLQERPDLARRGIRLTRDMDGRPLIYVDKHAYHSADEIPDPEVSVFIRETIQIWENQ